MADPRTDRIAARHVAPHIRVVSRSATRRPRPADAGPLIVGVPTLGGNYAAGGNRPHTQRAEDVTVVIDGQTFTGPTNNALVKIGDYWNG